MHLHQQSIGSHDDSGASQDWHQAANSGCMARVDDHRQSAYRLQYWYRSYIENVAGCRVEASYSAFAKDDVGIAEAGDTLRRLKKIRKRGAHPAFQQNCTATCAEALEEREIFHAARAHLQDVGILRDLLDIGLRHHLGHDRHARLTPSFCQDLQSIDSESLKRVGGRSRLIGSATQDAHSTGNEEFGGP